MKNLGFSKKIIIATCSIIAVALTSLSVVNYNVVEKQTTASLQSNLKEMSRTSSSNIAGWLNGKLSSIEAVAASTGPISEDMNRNELALIKNAGGYVYVYVGSEQGVMVMDDPNEKLPADYDPRGRPWYTKTKSTMSSSFTEPYVDATSSAVLISTATPIRQNGSFAGVAAGDLSLNYIVETLSEINFNGIGHAYIVSKEGKILVHSDSSLNGKNISEVYSGSNLTIQPELAETNNAGKEVLVGFFPITGVPTVDWSLAVEINKNQAYASMSEIRNLSFILTPIAILLSMIVISVLLGKLTQPLRKLQVAMKDVAQGEGDLTRRLEIESKDEIGQLAESFNSFVHNIHVMMIDFKANSGQMNTIAEVMNQTSQSSQQEMEKQRRETEQVATAVAEMSSASNEIAMNAQGAAEAARDADREGEVTNKVVEEAIASIQGLATNLDSAETVIAELDQEVAQISTVLEVIKGIAEQTNLLALNAAIEAARAGEQGRGFAVVADEVRNLAGKTQVSTEEINAKITSLQDGAKRAVETMRQSKETSIVSVQKAGEAGESLAKISEAIARISDMNVQIATASEEQTNVSEEISRNVVNIADSTEATFASSNQIVETSSELSSIGRTIDQEVNKFII